MNYIPTEEQAYVRDTNSGALLNTDDHGLEIYRARRAKHKQDRTLQLRVETIEANMVEMKSDLAEILRILKEKG